MKVVLTLAWMSRVQLVGRDKLSDSATTEQTSDRDRVHPWVDSRQRGEERRSECYFETMPDAAVEVAGDRS